MVDPVAVSRDEALFFDIGIDVVRPHSPPAPQAKRGNVPVPQEIAHVVLTEPQPMRDVRHLDQARAGKQGVEGHQGLPMVDRTKPLPGGRFARLDGGRCG